MDVLGPSKENARDYGSTEILNVSPSEDGDNAHQAWEIHGSQALAGSRKKRETTDDR